MKISPNDEKAFLLIFRDFFSDLQNISPQRKTSNQDYQMKESRRVGDR